MGCCQGKRHSRALQPRGGRYNNGVQNVTDGTSSTIAFGEALVGDRTIAAWQAYRDGPVRHSNPNFAGARTNVHQRRPGQCYGTMESPTSVPAQAAFNHHRDPTTCRAGFTRRERGLHWASWRGGLGLFRHRSVPARDLGAVQNSRVVHQLGTHGQREASGGKSINANSNFTPGGTASFSPTASASTYTSSVSGIPDLLARRDQGSRQGHLVPIAADFSSMRPSPTSAGWSPSPLRRGRSLRGPPIRNRTTAFDFSRTGCRTAPTGHLPLKRTSTRGHFGIAEAKPEHS